MDSVSVVSLKTIRVSDETHKELTKVGKYGDSMDDIIKKLLQTYHKQQK